MQISLLSHKIINIYNYLCWCTLQLASVCWRLFLRHKMGKSSSYYRSVSWHYGKTQRKSGIYQLSMPIFSNFVFSLLSFVRSFHYRYKVFLLFYFLWVFWLFVYVATGICLVCFYPPLISDFLNAEPKLYSISIYTTINKELAKTKELRNEFVICSTVTKKVVPNKTYREINTNTITKYKINKLRTLE